jgi:CubicO group peptidase (beta-lactamase class C family)
VVIALLLVGGGLVLASRFGLVALIANGSRAVAAILLGSDFLALLVTVATTSADAAPPADFEQRVEQLRRAYEVPGVSIAVVEKGQVTLAEGWGVRAIGTSDKVDADTIFATGSTGKAFTVAALAVLVEQGKIKWDDKVIDHMPDFRMWDSWVTREMTIRDLLVHRSGLGLGAGDLLFVPNSDLPRKETVRRLRYIKPATSFRSAYAYDNVLYMVAGQLIEEVSGQTWEQFVKQHVYRPLGMNHSTVSDTELQATANRGKPHSRSGGAIVGLGTQKQLDERATLSATAAPAGGLAISANDMTRWLLTQLGRGKIPGGDARLFSEANSVEMWTPVTPQPISERGPEFKAVTPNFYLYGLGWDVEDYRGAKLIWHGGAVFGSLAALALLPDQDVGLFIAVNSEEGEVVRGLMYELLDHYLGKPVGQWPEKLHDWKMDRLNEAAKMVTSQTTKPAGIGPSLPLDRYTGDFADPWYGTIQVRKLGKGLTIEFPHSTGMDGALTHYQYDTFRTNPSLGWVEPAYVTFSLDADGKVDRVTMKPVSPVADFSFDYQDLLFTPVAAK